MSLDQLRTVIDDIGIAWIAATPVAGTRHTPVVVLHGLGSSSREFTYLAEAPGLDQRQLVLIDIPGFGDSDKPGDWCYAMEAQADLIATLIRTASSFPVTLVGHSMGGSIAVALASQHPNLIERIVVAEPNLDPGTGSLSGHIARQSEGAFVARGYRRLLYQTRREAERGDTVADRFRVTLEQASPVALHRSAMSLRADRSSTFREQLGALSIPRTLIWGEFTPPLDPPLADPAIAVAVIPAAGHVMMTEQPTAFAAAIHRALNDDANP
jgi:pimeloyl-ACP methyl ester carboxylesterase